MTDKKRNVLLVDDEAVVRNSLSEWLKDDGYDVASAEDGESALKILKERQFDTAVVDLKMPGVDGLEVLRKAKQTYPQINIIIITAYGTVENAVEAMKRGAVDYLTKPFTPADLEKAIENAYRKAQGLAGLTEEASTAVVTPQPVVEKPKAEPKAKECIWSKAGVVSHRICINNFRCDTCEFGQSMMDKGVEAADRPMMMDAMKKLLEKPGPKRACRYMLSGDVSYRLCSNLYQCGKCSFNEYMEAKLEAESAKMAARVKAMRARKAKQKAGR